MGAFLASMLNCTYCYLLLSQTLVSHREPSFVIARSREGLTGHHEERANPFVIARSERSERRRDPKRLLPPLRFNTRREVAMTGGTSLRDCHAPVVIYPTTGARNDQTGGHREGPARPRSALEKRSPGIASFPSTL